MFYIFSHLKETVSGLEHQVTNLETAQQIDTNELTQLKSSLEDQISVLQTSQQNDASKFTRLIEELTKSAALLEAVAAPSMTNIHLSLIKFLDHAIVSVKLLFKNVIILFNYISR